MQKLRPHIACLVNAVNRCIRPPIIGMLAARARAGMNKEQSGALKTYSRRSENWCPHRPLNHRFTTPEQSSYFPQLPGSCGH